MILLLMVMRYDGWDTRCPYCLSKQLKVIGNDVADPKYHERFGHFWALLECKKCGGVCQDIHNHESDKERKAKLEARRAAREAQANEEISS